MDDQTQQSFNPNVYQAQPRRGSQTPPPIQPNQPPQAAGGLPQAQPSQTFLSRGAAPSPVPSVWQPANLQPDLPQESLLVEEVELIVKPRRRLRSCLVRAVVLLVVLLIGVAIGLGSVLWYGWSGEGPIVIIPNSTQGNLIVEANKDLLTQLVRKNIANANLPGQVKNVNVTLERGDALTIQGDDVYGVFGFNLSRHFTIHVQPYVKSCVLQVRVTKADLGGIPVTGFVQSFEGQINQQLAAKPAGLPGGLTYCVVGVRTEPGGIFITYEAVLSGQ
jgi:hypothetical protein